VVIDANLIAQLSRSMAGLSLSCSADPSPIFDGIAMARTRVVTDEGGQIINEWQSCVSPEWFEAWFFTFASQGNVVSIPVNTCQQTIDKLKKSHGFPASTRDKWLARTALTEASDEGTCDLLTEDMDFYEPRLKKANNRSKYLSGAIVGGVTKQLATEDVFVVSLAGY
jgi:hypothetical protein